MNILDYQVHCPRKTTNSINLLIQYVYINVEEFPVILWGSIKDEV